MGKGIEKNKHKIKSNDKDEFSNGGKQKFKNNKPKVNLNTPSNFKNNKGNNSNEVQGQEKKRRRELNSETLDLRRLYNKLMLKKDNNKPEIIKKILNIVKDNFKEYAYKHDGCRVLQGSIKYGTKEQRSLLIKNLKEIIYELSTKKYSIFLAIKIWKYAEKEQQQEILNSLLAKLSLLVKSPSGEMFLNYVFSNSISKFQELMIETYLKFILKLDLEELKKVHEDDLQSQPKVADSQQNKETENTMEIDDEENEEEKEEEEKEEKGNILVKKSETYQSGNLKEKIKKIMENILEKGLHRNFIFHATLSKIFDFFSQDTKAYLSELFDDDFEVFLNSKSSIEIAMRLYTVASTKTKKKIIKKVFKEDWANSLLANDFNFLLLSKIFLSTDDTKLTIKQIMKPLIAYADSVDYKVIVKVFHGVLSPNRFSTGVGSVSSLLNYTTDASSKKDLNKIQLEILLSLKEKLVNLLELHSEHFLKDKELSFFLLDLIEFLTTVKDEETESLLKSVLEKLVTYLEFDYKHNQEKLILDNNGHMIIGKLIKSLVKKREKTDAEYISSFITRIIGIMKTDLEGFLATKGVFLVLNIFEDSQYTNEIKKELLINVPALEKITKEQVKLKNSAAAILLKKLKE